jgi:predicted phosphodiesterase
MRYGVIADVHANLHALEAVIAALEERGVDRYLCTGDLVGYGPRPNECVARLRELDATTVAGNHDLMASGRLSLDIRDRLARTTLEWTVAVLDSDTTAYLESLPLNAGTPDGLILAHGTLDDPVEYVYECEAATAQLDLLGERSATAAGLLLGHTHLPLACRTGSALPHTGVVDLPGTGLPFVLNPGSVGQSRGRRPLARALILELELRRAEFLALEYDHQATVAELRAAGLPPGACHRSPRLHKRLLRALPGPL